MIGSWDGRTIHFIGVGGAGMSGLALVCHRLGADVSGSDRSESSYFERIREAGVNAIVGHDESNLPEFAEVVVSTAIGEDNPELALARVRGQRVLHRSDLLAELCASKRTIAVAGTHGKTTTTGMLIWSMKKMGLDPAFFVGGELPSVGDDGGPANSGWGDGEWAVVEADESDGSFLVLDPEVAVVTNIEMDHHSRWNGLAELRAAFAEFTGKASGIALPVEESELPEVLPGKELIRFDLNQPGPETVELVVPGEHNLLDARAALAALELAGFDSGDGARALADFPGVKRRLEFKGESAGTRIYDDYAHHPTEVKASLTALRELDPERLIAVFQPHLYSRTKVFSQAFGAALAVADEVIVLDVYPAREAPVGPFEGVSGLDVLRATADRSGGGDVIWAPDLDKAQSAAISRLGQGRILVTIGAGDITKLSDRLVQHGGAAS
ncbi:MAG: Mur ligase domain-containing protein [Solirubrobacterales bacterium]